MLGDARGTTQGGRPSIGGGAQPAMGSGPAQAGGTYYAPPPSQAQVGEDYAQANDAYKRALIRFNSQRTGLLRQYGYAGDVNPDTGMVQNLRVDAGNTYGALQSLLHNQALEDQSAQYAAEDRGLHGGLAHQAESELHYGHQGQSSALVNALLGNLGDINSQQLDAKGALDAALWQLTHQAAANAVDNGDFNPALVDGSGGGGDGASGSGSGGGGAPNALAKTVAQQIASASMAALTKSRKSGSTPAAAALAARSAGLNAQYGLGSSKPAAKPAPNAYTSGKKKRG